LEFGKCCFSFGGRKPSEQGQEPTTNSTLLRVESEEKAANVEVKIFILN